MVDYIAGDGWAIERVSVNAEARYLLSHRGFYMSPPIGYSLEALQQVLQQYGLDLDDFEEADPTCG
jgi:hypothetical protein